MSRFWLFLFTAIAICGSSSSSSPPVERLALPNPKPKRRFSNVFRPVANPRRIVERMEFVQEDGQTYHAHVYEPPRNPVPWTVRAWYDERRRTHVIDIAAHPELHNALRAKVYWSTSYNADRRRFRSIAWDLPPDDKFVNRVTKRLESSRNHGCFLIDLVAGGGSDWDDEFQLDFFHEPDIHDALVNPIQSQIEVAKEPEVDEQTRLTEEIVKIQKQYRAAMEKIGQQTDLNEDERIEIAGYLDKIRVDALSKLTGAGA